MVEDDPFSNLAYTNHWTSTSDIATGASQAFFVDSSYGCILFLKALFTRCGVLEMNGELHEYFEFLFF